MPEERPVTPETIENDTRAVGLQIESNHTQMQAGADGRGAARTARG